MIIGYLCLSRLRVARLSLKYSLIGVIVVLQVTAMIFCMQKVRKVYNCAGLQRKQSSLCPNRKFLLLVKAKHDLEADLRNFGVCPFYTGTS